MRPTYVVPAILFFGIAAGLLLEPTPDAGERTTLALQQLSDGGNVIPHLQETSSNNLYAVAFFTAGLLALAAAYAQSRTKRNIPTPEIQ